jgi:hypothetical protein
MGVTDRSRPRRRYGRAAFVAALAAAVLIPIVAQASGTYDLRGTWETSSVIGGGYTGTFEITSMDLATGSFSGTGDGTTFVLKGTETGASVKFTQSEGSYVSHDSATVTQKSGKLEMTDGTWHDSNGSGGTFAAVLNHPASGSGSGSGAPTPVLAQSVAGATVSGAVTVERPGTHTFVTLSKAGLIPVGSLVNATHGRVTLTAATASGGVTHTGQFYDGEFMVGQTQRGLTTLKLAGGAPCAAAAAANTRAPTRRRRLWGSAHGDFETIGTDAAATELGTTWLTQDTCTGTVVRVSSGAVRVTNRLTGRSLVVRAPHSYLAKPTDP